MKVAIDIQGIQSEGSRVRGIGRYSFDLVKSILKFCPKNEYILVANGALKNLKNEFNLEIKHSNVSYVEWNIPFIRNSSLKNHEINKLSLFLRSFSFRSLHADIILVTSFIEGYSDNCLTDFDFDLISIPVVSIFYDVIPLIHPNLYLYNNHDFSKFYKQKLHQLKQLSGLLAISESSSNEAIKYLGFDSSKIYNISSACDKNRFNQIIDKSKLLVNNFSLRSSYLMYSGASDPRKNVKGLIEAFSKLADEFSNYKLLLVGKLLDPEIELIDSWISEFNISCDRVIKLGFVSIDDLVLLYQNCSLFIFPSFHEGFGLPLLEAMSCGAPVIGSNVTSIPEVIGSSKALFDPKNVDKLVQLIEKSLVDKDFREFLIQNAITQSKKFSWNKTAQTAINALEKVFSNNQNIHNISDWSSYLNFKHESFNILLSKFKEIPIITHKSNRNLIKEVSSCIDIIIKSSDSIIRKRYLTINNISWKVEGPFDSNYSLALVNSFFTESMIDKVQKLSIYITEGFGDYIPNLDYLIKYKNIYSLYKTSKDEKSTSNFVSRNLYPPRVKDMNHLFNMIHAYGWEESVFPSEWVENFNSYLQCVTVMSSQVKKILIDNGVNIPIKVCGLGLDHILNIIPDYSFTVKAKDYKILHISSCFPRKGVDVLLKAYRDSFRITDNVTLIIKTFDNPHNEIDLQLKKLREDDLNFPDVQVIKEDLNPSQIKALYLQSNVLVAPSCGEGFGLPIGEAMILGLPVITTNWGGQTDFCNDSNCWLLNYEFSISKTHFNLDNSYWANPCSNHLSSLLKELFNSSKEEILQKTIIAQKSLLSYTWNNVSHITKSFALETITTNSNNISRIGWVSTWNSKCGIASYSHHLLDHMHENILIFTPFNEPAILSENNTILKSWTLDSHSGNDLDILYDHIIANNLSSIVIQFNYGFFNFNELTEFIFKIKSKEINIIVFLHSTIDPAENSSKSLSDLKDTFLVCDRLMVHTVSDVNRLKSIGLIDNVCLFPHGILEFNTLKNSPLLNLTSHGFNNRRRIASFGFCLPNKGYFELIKSIKILYDQNFKIELSIFSAIYSPDYSYVLDQLNDLITELNMQKWIHINSDYVSDKYILDSLSKYDLTIFPYQRSNESSSAAVRQGLACLKPVLVTPLPIFDDVSDLVDYLPGLSSEDIANGLKNWYCSNKNSTIDQRSKYEERNRKLKYRMFPKLAYKLLSIIKSLELNIN